ncbi:MAG TPA: GrpB family protein [Pyrinomonadaceae bacterium]|jgi:GrpB-like predicted nucleotidyltransferase (UPF0157 family)|nr:GrpB family protein [Pyrinomonadaceae bacterium]
MAAENEIIIADYDPRWPMLYAQERELILSLMAQDLAAIEHIGSTAVPGLGAKPIIDIMAAVRSLRDAERCIEPLARIGYEYVPEFEDVMPERRYFRKSAGRTRTHHLHMVELSSDFWRRHLLFRNFLRAHPSTAHQYYCLKKELARKFRTKREAYTDAKTSFIEDIVKRAQMESGTDNSLPVIC